jgi:hypothetical protein
MGHNLPAKLQAVFGRNTNMRVAWVLTFCSAVSFAQDVREIVVRSLAQNKQNAELSRGYMHVERMETRNLDDADKSGSPRSNTFDVILLDGTPYRRLTARDDKPLSAAEERKEQEKLNETLTQRRGESKEERARRFAEWERRRREISVPLQEIPAAFNLKILGEEIVNGEDTWIIEALPRQGYKPGKGFARFFPKVKGRFWISKRDYAWVKVDAEVLDTISYGFIVARLQKGSRLHFEQARIHGDVWVPKRIQAAAAVRLAIFKRMHTGYEITYKDYRRVEVESRLVGYHELTQ